MYLRGLEDAAQRPRRRPATDALVRRAGPGAADVLYRRFAGRIYGLGLVMLGNDAAAQDLVQDTFVKLWRSAERYDRSRGKLETWVLLMARSLAIDAIRRRVLEARTLEHVDRPAEADQDPGPTTAPPRSTSPTAPGRRCRRCLRSSAPRWSSPTSGGRRASRSPTWKASRSGRRRPRIRAALLRLRELLAADIESARGGERDDV